VGARGHPRLRHRLPLLSFAILLALASTQLRADEPLSYSLRSVAGLSLHVIEVDLNNPRVVVSPAIAAGGIGRQEPFSGFIGRLSSQGRLRLVAAINGTFFSKTSRCPIGDIVRDGKVVHFGGMGTALAFAPDGVDCIRLPKSRHVDWSEHRAALAAGPLLVWNGFAKPVPGGEGFGDPSVFARVAPRSAAGITKDNRLLLVTTARGASLANLAAALGDLGAVYAMNLDGGASAAMWFQGEMIRRPRRPLTNLLCVYLNPVPAAPRNLRPPQGLDWRAGHPPRPLAAFSTEGLRLRARLPRKWEGKQSVLIEADAPLPGGWVVSLRLNESPVGLAGSLPAEIPLDLSGLKGPNPKHRLWIGVLDREGKAVGGVERIFKVGGRG